MYESLPTERQNHPAQSLAPARHNETTVLPATDMNPHLIRGACHQLWGKWSFSLSSLFALYQTWLCCVISWRTINFL